MIIKFLCLLIFQIKNAFGEFDYQGDVNAQFDPVWPNQLVDLQINTAFTDGLPNLSEYPSVIETAISIPNPLLNTLLPAVDVNNLLINANGLQYFNNLPMNEGLNFVKNDVSNVLGLRDNQVFSNSQSNLMENDAKLFYNNGMSNPIVNNIPNKIPVVDNLPNNMQIIKPTSNHGYQISNELNYKQPVRNDLVSSYLYSKSPQANLLAIQNAIPSITVLPTSNRLYPVLGHNRVPLNDKLGNYLPVLKPGNLNQDVIISHPSMTSVVKNNKYLNKNPATTLANFPFISNNDKYNNLCSDNGIPSLNKQYASFTPGINAVNNNIPPSNKMLRNPPVTSGFNEEQLFPRYTAPMYIDSNVMNTFALNNKLSSDDGIIMNTEIPNYQMFNMLPGNIYSNRNIMSNHMMYSSGNNMPLNKQMIFDSYLSNNADSIPLSIIPDMQWPIRVHDYASTDRIAPVALVTSEPTLGKFYAPTNMANANILNLGEFGSLPIINGLPVASIVETITVINPNSNCH